MFKKILLLLDGSERAEVVFHYAQQLSGGLGFDLELLHVASPRDAEELPMRRAYIERLAQLLCTDAGPESKGQCVIARGTVVVGDAAEEILTYIEDHEVDLVMMSTHGRSGERSFSLGSVAHKVVHASKAPVWLVPPGLREDTISATIALRPICVPLSGSKKSEAAVSYALKVAESRPDESEIVLLHSVPVDPEWVGSLGGVKEREDHAQQMEAYLERVAETVREAGFAARSEVLRGDPAEAILGFLADEPAQLLTMATRGRTGLSRMVFGSVAEEVIHSLKKTPMLLVSESE